MDRDLNPDELELARLSIEIGTIIETDPTPNTGIWVEDIIPPMSEDDALSSCLYTEPGNSNPKSGFTLWVGDKVYKVTFEKRELLWNQQKNSSECRLKR